MQFNLMPHPSLPPANPHFDLWVDVQHAHLLASLPTTSLSFGVGASMDRFVVAPSAEPGRADGLWQTTCFEFFLQPIGQEGYREWNFAPSGDWAAYDFLSIRSGRTDAEISSPPYISVQDNLTWWETAATVTNELRQPWAVGLSVVLEEKDGTKSYWALAHPPGEKPDFHHRDCFAAKLP